MKKGIIAIFIVLSLMLMPCMVFAESGSSSESDGESYSDSTPALRRYTDSERFYYTVDGNKINISFDGTTATWRNDGIDTIIACYDDDVLIKTKIIKAAPYINGFGLNDFTIDLDSVPNNLVIKSYMWRGNGKAQPLWKAAELKNVPGSAYHVIGRVKETSYTGSGLDNDVVLFSIDLSDNFDEDIVLLNDFSEHEIKIGNTDIKNHYGERVEAYIIKDEETEEYTFLYYEPLEDLNVTLTRDDIDITRTASSQNIIYDTSGKGYVLSDYYDFSINYSKRDYQFNDIVSLIQAMPEKSSYITLSKCPQKTMMWADAEEDDEEILYDCVSYVSDEETSLEGAEAMTDEEQPVSHTDRLTGAEGELVVIYDENSKTAMLDGVLNIDSDGEMPYDITVDFMPNVYDVTSSTTFESNTVFNKLKFGSYDMLYMPEYSDENYRLYSKAIPLEQEPYMAKIKLGSNIVKELNVVSSDAYKVYGRIIGYGDAKVKFRVERSDNFMGEEISPFRGKDLPEIDAPLAEYIDPSCITEYALAYIAYYEDYNMYSIQYLQPLT